MTYAIIETGGKQLRVEPGRFYDIELLAAEPDETVAIDKVLLVQHDGDVTIGQPFIDGATVQGKVMRHWRGRKVLVYKMRPKKKTRKKRGHRQELTRLTIDSITLNGLVLTAPEIVEEPQAVTVTSVVESPVETETPTSTPEVAEAIPVTAVPVEEEPSVETETETTATSEPAETAPSEVPTAEVEASEIISSPLPEDTDKTE
jgi:large subunit ribosomal protein L21